MRKTIYLPRYTKEGGIIINEKHDYKASEIHRSLLNLLLQPISKVYLPANILLFTVKELAFSWLDWLHKTITAFLQISNKVLSGLNKCKVATDKNEWLQSRWKYLGKIDLNNSQHGGDGSETNLFLSAFMRIALRKELSSRPDKYR